MEKRVITYIIISIIAAILLGDLWVLHMQLDGIHKVTKAVDNELKKNEDEQKTSEVKSDTQPHI